MKKLILVLFLSLSFSLNNVVFSQVLDNAKKPMVVGNEDGSGNVQSGRIYASYNRGASRSQNGGTNGGIFGSQGEWSVDLTISQYTSANALAQGWEGTAHNGMGALGWGSYAAGAYNRSSGVGSVALGFHNVAGATNSEATGIADSSIGQVAFGYGTLASGNAAFTSGRGTEASGSYSKASGYYTTASDYGSFVIGSWNSSGSSATSSTSFSTSAPAFVIGNGTASNAKSDAFKVMFNGDATLGNDLTVSGDITISSDARLKSNIVSLGATLSKLLLIDGKSYDMKGKEKIGVLAQEVKQVFPELVSTDENDMYSVNYQGLVPILINAIKEQDDKISRLENLVEQLILEKK